MGKNKKIKAVILLLVITSISAISIINAYATVDLAGGIEAMSDEVISQAKAIATIVFGVIALICLIITVATGIFCFVKHRRHEEYEVGPVIGCGIGTIIASLCAAGSFFSWFGL